MGTLFATSSYFTWRNPQLNQIQTRDSFHERPAEKIGLRGDGARELLFTGRRDALVSGLCLISGAVLMFPKDAFAVKQGLLAGRIPGLSGPDERGWRTYKRPDDKSGGHGVGWSPIIPYSFKVKEGWEEVPVSIADLGGTEIDLRFANSQEGRLFVIVAPVLRFAVVVGNGFITHDITFENMAGPQNHQAVALRSGSDLSVFYRCSFKGYQDTLYEQIVIRDNQLGYSHSVLDTVKKLLDEHLGIVLEEIRKGEEHVIDKQEGNTKWLLNNFSARLYGASSSVHPSTFADTFVPVSEEEDPQVEVDRVLQEALARMEAYKA